MLTASCFQRKSFKMSCGDAQFLTISPWIVIHYTSVQQQHLCFHHVLKLFLIQLIHSASEQVSVLHLMLSQILHNSCSLQGMSEFPLLKFCASCSILLENIIRHRGKLQGEKTFIENKDTFFSFILYFLLVSCCFHYHSIVLSLIGRVFHICQFSSHLTFLPCPQL
jgi:hypothetical protein